MLITQMRRLKVQLDPEEACVNITRAGRIALQQIRQLSDGCKALDECLQLQPKLWIRDELKNTFARLSCIRIPGPNSKTERLFVAKDGLCSRNEGVPSCNDRDLQSCCDLQS